MYTKKRSSDSDEWETPSKFYTELAKEFGFTMDVCASYENHKHERYITKEMDALSQHWFPHICWMNPPYSEKKAWVQKAYEESLLGATVVCLLPANTDTGWFHDYAQKGEVRFIRGKLKFNKMKYNAPFPSMLVIFRPPA